MSATRLPGIYFETVPTAPSQTLPRMDIAAFVGFAPSGPLDVPVAIEDAGRYQEIFGTDQALAWDAVQGEMAYAQTPAAVRAFFRNGGDRCWMVRVADNTQAVSNQFLLAGMLQGTTGEDYGPGWLMARSEGSWSDDFNVNTTLSFGAIEAEAPSQNAGTISILLYPNSTTDVSVGDLLQISFDQIAGSPAEAPGPILFLAAESVSDTTITNASGGLQKVALVSSTSGYWFQAAAEADFAAIEASSSPSQGDAGVQPLVAPLDVSWLTSPEAAGISISGWGFDRGADPMQFVFDAPRDEVEQITPGSWLRVKLTPGALPGGARELLLRVAGVRGSPAVPGLSSPAASETMQVFTAGAWWALDGVAVWARDLSRPRAAVVTLELWSRDGTGQVTTLSNLGLTPLHPLYLGYLPTDAELFTQSENPAPPPGIDLWALADNPRFALASPQDSAIYLPLGVPGILDSDFYQPALDQPGTPLERDGLALANGQLTSAMFVDPDLVGSTVDTLLVEAFHKMYQLQRGDGPVGEPLTKMHAVLPIDEVSLLALPDATQPGWQQEAQAQTVLGAPILVQSAAAASQLTLGWTPVDTATGYTLEQSADPLFSTSKIVWQGPGQRDGSNPALVDSDPIAQSAGCPAAVYYRVAALQGTVAGPWSNTMEITEPSQAFLTCTPSTLAAPVMGQAEASRGRVALAWTTSTSGIAAYELQLAYEPAFALPEVLYQGPNNYFELWSDPTRTAYFRVSATQSGLQSPWSNTAVIPSDQLYTRYVMNTPLDLSVVQSIGETELMKTHQAMLRLCAARADMVTFLSLPQSYDSGTSVLYRKQLTQLLGPGDGGYTLSFGAIYFPWLTVRDSADDQPGAIRTISPEGAALGSTAAVTLASGAWYSPANQVLKGVVDLLPKLDDQAPLTFFNNQLNFVAQESRGFVTTSSFTLSTDSQLTEINVRRLLILLRRLALQEGVKYVFQSNDNTLWRIVRRRFEEILNNLFLQGAFAGGTPDQSFRVRTDSSVNPSESVEQGNFIVEISIAPSLPLEFLTVRLMQTGGDLTFSEV